MRKQKAEQKPAQAKTSRSKKQSAREEGSPQAKPFRLTARTPTQSLYLQTIRDNELTFGLGPAGTGKTFLAVAAAVKAYQNKEVERLILVRPAVEAGEKLGYLPGTIAEKVAPYLTPLTDALRTTLGPNQMESMAKSGQIELASLAFMRGRTLERAYIIVDEAQNTTVEQMLMITTRLGEGSRMIITGDPSQVDLPRSVTSGLSFAQEAFKNVKGIGFCAFSEGDVVRHELVGRIITAHRKWKDAR